MHSVKRVRTTEEQKARQRRIEAGQIKEYRKLMDEYLEMRAQNRHDEESLNQTTELLERNPETYTVWNYRREIFGDLFKSMSDEDKKARLTKELKFIEDRLRKYPKVYWIWNHRRWTLENFPQAPWDRELAIVSKMLELDSRNFHGWHYRRYVVGELEKSHNKSLVKPEFDYTTSKINANFSNFSAWHQRAKLIPRLLKETGQDPRELLHSELEYIRQALYTDPDDQSSWIYHRWLLSTNQIVPDLSANERAKIITNEIKSIEELDEIEPDNKWCMDALVFYGQLLAKVESRPLTAEELGQARKHLSKLKQIDPMRKNRYQYVETSLEQ